MSTIFLGLLTGMAFGYVYLKHGSLLPSLKGGAWLTKLRSRFRERQKADDDQRMDDLLRKVNDQGIQSLTDEEKQFLHRMSRTKKWH